MRFGVCILLALRDGQVNIINMEHWKGYGDFNGDCRTLGMLLDLDNGTLSVYQDGQRLGTLKDGLAGEYCWFVGFWSKGDVSIERGYNMSVA